VKGGYKSGLSDVFIIVLLRRADRPSFACERMYNSMSNINFVCMESGQGAQSHMNKKGMLTLTAQPMDFSIYAVRVDECASSNWLCGIDPLSGGQDVV
jgi:hypothetical protein